MSQLIDIIESPENNVSTYLVKQIIDAISTIRWGSVEVFIQNNKIVQITKRSIEKPQIEEKDEHSAKVTS